MELDYTAGRYHVQGISPWKKKKKEIVLLKTPSHPFPYNRGSGTRKDRRDRAQHIDRRISS